MRPTFSIIFFTVISGAGYGLWMLVGLAFALAWPGCLLDAEIGPVDAQSSVCGMPSTLAVAWATGFLLVSAGLLSSLAHLGQPQRAWRALSQWRSSWLSREGVAALLAYVPATGLFLIWLGQQSPGHLVPALLLENETLVRVTGALLAAASIVTVFCTANIYACLKPIRAWNNRLVVPAYLAFAALSGMLLLWALATLPSRDLVPAAQETVWSVLLPSAVIVLAVISAAIKLTYWKQIDQPSGLRTAHVIGLDGLGNVRSFEQPHTQENYLTHEMGFRIARKHSRKLRLICLLAGFATPAILALLALLVPGPGGVAAWIGLLAGMFGIFLERWLFFAEARHAVMLYYGAHGD
ncbi:MAG: dimethyl sulfoxide reductase anchor subunit [Xanthomonadales bacterium]|uniref:dimethyl sulfoxide reductase anchor subunit family protein n=1 Tax=Dokdonella sp. TaxID=2291710 RepID=UPI002B67E3B5|nr:dimethyl sulfoxide reductase anchor subunit [Xanthomonadales bacterium]MBL0222390.1 dimethyl sulfoxide reductase anchor subunit [Xanthomonadales bacterium]HQZ62492.1 dimethyl sulfoxide reductase anchor subunit [Dokdonella sp.]